MECSKNFPFSSPNSRYSTRQQSAVAVATPFMLRSKSSVAGEENPFKNSTANGSKRRSYIFCAIGICRRKNRKTEHKKHQSIIVKSRSLIRQKIRSPKLKIRAQRPPDSDNTNIRPQRANRERGKPNCTAAPLMLHIMS